ncbi:hypothetical protein M9434_003858 [Picochlorum sp. BPE23]|nr:hypothetical protein M9434_003858 [Picochlorum sp. BPE23]
MGKKRKSHESNEGDQFKLKIKPNSSECTLVSFPSGYKPGTANEEWQAFEHAECKTRGAIVLATDKNVDFIGKCSNSKRGKEKDGMPNAEGEEESNSSSHVMLGVFDRAAGRLTLSHVQSNGIIRMQPRIHTVSYEEDASMNREETATGSDLADLRRERNAKLIEAFGSQRRKRQLATAKAGRVDASQISAGDAMINIIRSTEADPGKREDVIKKTLADRNIPPHNPEATTPEDAYPFDSIVPRIIQDSIDTSLLTQALSDGSILGDVKQKFGKYVASRVGAASNFATTDDKLPNRILCLALLGHLLSLYTDGKRLIIRVKTDAGGIQATAQGLGIPTSTLEGILSLFYSREEMDDGTKYIMDKRKKNLLLAWCLVLAIRAEPDCLIPSFAFQILCEQLKMKPAEVASVYRELGCQTSRSRQSYQVTLLKQKLGQDPVTLDMSFPALKLGARKR